MKEEIKKIKYRAIEYGEKNNLDEEDVAYFMTLMDDYRNAILEEERNRILEGINEFSHCKKWELDETTDFYIDARVEQIKELINPPLNI